MTRAPVTQLDLRDSSARESGSWALSEPASANIAPLSDATSSAENSATSVRVPDRLIDEGAAGSLHGLTGEVQPLGWYNAAAPATPALTGLLPEQWLRRLGEATTALDAVHRQSPASAAHVAKLRAEAADHVTRRLTTRNTTWVQEGRALPASLPAEFRTAISDTIAWHLHKTDPDGRYLDDVEKSGNEAGDSFQDLATTVFVHSLLADAPTAWRQAAVLRGGETNAERALAAVTEATTWLRQNPLDHPLRGKVTTALGWLRETRNRLPRGNADIFVKDGDILREDLRRGESNLAGATGHRWTPMPAWGQDLENSTHPTAVAYRQGRD
ncbi:hypothetical protein, partial [Enterococcus hirae]|uniref:hypothetical protein n=1 Tax=Enterococcus hirae TaxID=1354 RepID=UPI001369BBE9